MKKSALLVLLLASSPAFGDEPPPPADATDRRTVEIVDTVGRTAWPVDQQGRPIYPDGFEDLAKKLEEPY